MPYEVNQIVLEVDDEASGPVKKANAELDKFEKAGERASAAATRTVENTARGLVSITDRSRNAIDRIVATIEKKASFAGRSGVDALVEQRGQTIQRVAGDPKAIERVTEAYGRLIAAQRQADNSALLDRATAASRRAEQGTNQFAAAMRNAQEAAERQRRAIEEGIRALERRAALAGKSSSQRLGFEESEAVAKLGKSAADVDRVRAAYARLREEQDKPPAGIRRQIVESGILLGIAHQIVSVTKDLTVGTTLYAARTEQLGVALGAVGKANEISSGTTAVLVQRITQLGVTTQDARSNLARLIASQVDYTKATQLARAAQDLGRVSGEGTAAAFERITHAIVTGQPELLRHLGLNVNLEKAYIAVARSQKRSVESLTEQEKVQIRTNATLVAAQAYNGVYAASLDTVTGRLLSLRRRVDEAKNAIGEQFQREASLTIGVIERLVKAAEKFPSLAVAGGSAVSVLAGGLAVAFGGPVIAGIGAVVALLGQFVILSQGVGEIYSKLEPLINLIFGNKNISNEEARLQALKVAQEKFAESTRKRHAAVAEGEAQAAKLGEIQDAAKKKRLEEIAQAEGRAATLLQQAKRGELSGIADVIQEYRIYRKELGLSAKANSDLAEVVKIRLAAETSKELRRVSREYLSDLETATAAKRDNDSRRLQSELEYQRETESIRLKTLDDTLDAERSTARNVRDIRLRELEGLDARTVAQKNAVAEQKLRIEEEYTTREALLQVESIRRRQERELEYLNWLKQIRPDQAAQIEQRISAVVERSGQEARAVEREHIEDIERLRTDTAIARVERERDANRRIFEDTKRSVEGLLDQLLTRSRSWGEAMGAILKAAILQPLKDAASTLIASLLTGQRTQLGGAGGGGGRVGLGGILGGVFGGFGSAAGIGPGGTAPFNPNAPALTGTAGGGGAAGGFGIAAQLTSMKGMLTQLGQLGATNKAFAGGTYGAKGGAMLAGGGILAADGFRRGGLFGALETTAGGALIGAKFGGPIGALIGGGIGLGAGLIRMLFKGAEEKVIQKVKTVYGTTIDRNLAKQIALTAKQQYAGNIDMAIRQPQIRDLIELYAMSRAESFSGASNRPTPTTFFQSGGSVFQAPSITAGSLSIPSVASGGGSPQPLIIGNITLQVEGGAARDVFRGEAVDLAMSTPGLYQAASVQAQRQSSNRREAAALAIAPGLITA